MSIITFRDLAYVIDQESNLVAFNSKMPFQNVKFNRNSRPTQCR